MNMHFTNFTLTFVDKYLKNEIKGRFVKYNFNII